MKRSILFGMLLATTLSLSLQTSISRAGDLIGSTFSNLSAQTLEDRVTELEDRLDEVNAMLNYRIDTLASAFASHKHGFIDCSVQGIIWNKDLKGYLVSGGIWCDKNATGKPNKFPDGSSASAY